MELFRYPVLLAWLAAAFAALVFFRFKAEVSRLAAARQVLGPSFDGFAAGAPAARRRLRGLLYFIALALLAIAAAGPQWGVELSPVSDLKGNVVIAVDASLSMAARDLKPDRLSNARLLLGAIAEKFVEYRIGVVAFAGQAYVQCPLTTDQDAISYFASGLRPGMLPAQGTDFSEAIETVLGMLSRYGGQKVMVLITDGEDHSAGLDTALAAAAEQGLRIFTIGIGNPEGELVPRTDSAGNIMEYMKDRQGKTVVSRMDEAALMKIASKTGAAYQRYTDPDSAAEAVRSAVAALDLEKSKGKGRSGYLNRYQWPLAAALLLLLIELMIMEKGFSFNFSRPRFLPRFFGAAALLIFAAAAAQAAALGAEARKGNAAYDRGDWEGAIGHYSRGQAKAPGDKRLDFNIGSAYYRLEDYDKATESFDKASASPKVAARAHYNRGNALFKKGDLAGAIEAYRRTLDLKPGDENAKFNLQKALEQKQKNSCDKPEDKKENKDEKKDKDKDKKQGGGDKKDEKQEQEKQKQQEQEKKKAEARERSQQILEMMKEREKAAAQDPENLRQAARKAGKADGNRLEDW
jgi:Ca-activated chloride channel family protein